MKRVYLILLFLIPCSLLGQVPDWIAKLPGGYIHDYFIGKGVSKTSRAESISLANEDAIASIVRTGKITVTYSEYDSIGYEQKGLNANSNMNIIARTVREVNITGESKTIKGLKLVETYTEYNVGYYESWVLMSVPKSHPFEMPSPFSNTLKSIIIPGWGQFSSGSKLKGVTFLTLTAGSLISGLVFNELSNNASKDALASRTQQRRDFFNSQARTYSTFSIISFIAAVGLYVWNIADATAIKEEIVYVTIPSLINQLCINLKISL